ncbi:MAG TPA: dihydrolipoyl dehydrogenase [Terriglobia bacterium]|nr:dihydrolipoyl dehydrogenase [Terriglobia bacterium]
MPDEAGTTQLAVIGGGPGGYAAAFLAADLGLKVTLIDEQAQPGGVCLYRGCIPSKALLHAARVLTEAREASRWGIEFQPPRVDVDRLRAWKQEVVGKLTGGLAQIAKQRQVEYIRGRASLLDARTLSVATHDSGDKRLGFEYAILATGSFPAMLPGLPQSMRILDSTSALDLSSVPKTLLVVGGGYIGLELGTVYAALGTEVSVVEMLDGLLPGADRDLVAQLAKRIEKIFHKVMLSTKVAEMKEGKSGITVKFEGASAEGGEQVYEKVLVSVGRKPNSAIPGLEKTRVQKDAKAFIRIDAQRRTAEPTIYAVGDVAGEPMLAHKASHEGRTAVEAIAGHKVAFEPRAIPAVVFTDPEVAWCGLTETEAARENRPVKVARFPWAASGRAVTLDRSDGVTKLVIDPETERVLGVGITGVGAGDLIAEGVLAVEMAALASDVALTIHPHPTLSETVMEAAEVFYGQATDIYRPKKS